MKSYRWYELVETRGQKFIETNDYTCQWENVIGVLLVPKEERSWDEDYKTSYSSVEEAEANMPVYGKWTLLTVYE